MRFGNWRGVALAFAVSSALSAGLAATARADLFCHDIPRVVDAVNVHTGGPYYAPPIPYGCYAKDHCGHLAAACGLAKGALCGLLHPGLCGGCLGKGCGLCGGTGFGHGDGDPDGHCGGAGLGHGGGLFSGAGNSCAACGGAGCGFCRGLGLFKGNGHGHGGIGGMKCGECGGAGCGACDGHSSTVAASFQAPVIPSAQCGTPGCSISAKHSHRHLRCGGRGCGLCGGRGFCRASDPCGGCGGRGCGLCGGRGLCGNDPCGSCGGRGCGLCLGKGGLCRACGGVGCALCGKAHSLLGLPMGLVNKALHKGEIKYFVGPGGPVPITPGYVPYVNVTRSPRDFLAFPPFVDTVP